MPSHPSCRPTPAAAGSASSVPATTCGFPWAAALAGLLLNSHLDVVPPSRNHPFAPFDPVILDGCVYGRGAVDAKASVAAMVTAVLELAGEGYGPAGGSVIVALTACEEAYPEHNGLRHLRPKLPEIHAALVGEPTDMLPVVAQKGLLVLRATAHGRSAHAARAERGDNAILKAMHDIRQLEALVFEREHGVLGTPSLAVTTVRGGTARNVIPDSCTIEIDIRTTPAYTHDEIVAMVKGRLQSTVEVHSERIIPLSTDADEDIVRACLSAIPGAIPQGSPTASDWLYLADVPAVKIGPGSSELSHTAREQCLPGRAPGRCRRVQAHHPGIFRDSCRITAPQCHAEDARIWWCLSPCRSTNRSLRRSGCCRSAD